MKDEHDFFVQCVNAVQLRAYILISVGTCTRQACLYAMYCCLSTRGVPRMVDVLRLHASTAREVQNFATMLQMSFLDVAACALLTVVGSRE